MSITFGSASAPSQVITNLDALFSTSLAKYGKKMSDEISSANAFMHMLKKADYYEGGNGGTDIRQPTMYALATGDTYDGYDELGDAPIDGVTQSVWEWRQMSVPISYNMKEVVQNQGEKLIDLVDTKIEQAELGFQEMWPTHFFQGAGAGALYTPRTSPTNGSLSIEPIGKLIDFDPTQSRSVGNISQSANTWWRNRTKTANVSDLTGLIFEVENIYNTCCNGAGGYPNLMLMDQVTYEALTNAIYLKWRKVDNNPDKNFPFEHTMFKQAKMVWDEKMIDAYSGLTNTSTYGTIYFLNTKFFRVKYIEGREFDMLKDDNGKVFNKPLKGDSRLGHMAWMGQVCIRNRRKHGVYGKVPRTFTAT